MQKWCHNMQSPNNKYFQDNCKYGYKAEYFYILKKREEKEVHSLVLTLIESDVIDVPPNSWQLVDESYIKERQRENLLRKEFIKLNHQIHVILIYSTDFSQARDTKSWICCVNYENENVKELITIRVWLCNKTDLQTIISGIIMHKFNPHLF